MKAILCFLAALFLSSCSVSDAGDQTSPTPSLPSPEVPASLLSESGGLPVLSVYVLSGNAIEQLDIERYVAGVVAGEMRSDWPMEALRAQAILARTFVLKFVSEKESRYPGADISTDIAEAQAYNASAVNDRIEEAVLSTRGMVLSTADGTLPYAWFHAHSGGVTALAQEGLDWQEAEPDWTISMRGLDSPAAPVEAQKWSASFSAEAFLAACRKAGGKARSPERKRTRHHAFGWRLRGKRRAAPPGARLHGDALHAFDPAGSKGRPRAHGRTRLRSRGRHAAMGRLCPCAGRLPR